MERRYVFNPCQEERHDDCSATWSTTGAKNICACTCHNKKEEVMDFKIKTETKVTSITVELTPEVFAETVKAVRYYFGEEGTTTAQWERVHKAFGKVEKGE